MDFYGTDGYGFGSHAMSNSLATILMIYLLAILVLGIFSLASYIIKGIGLYTIAKRQGEENPWLAFVPFARTYLQGELGGEIFLKKKTIRNPGIWMVVLPIIQFVIFFVFYMIFFAVAGFNAFSAMNYYSGYYPYAGMATMIFVIVFVEIIVLTVAGAFVQVLKVLVNRQILDRFTTPNMSIVHAVFMCLVPMYEPICFLVMSRKPYNNDTENVQNCENETEEIKINECETENTQPYESQTFVPQRGLMNTDAWNAEVSTKDDEKSE